MSTFQYMVCRWSAVQRRDGLAGYVAVMAMMMMITMMMVVMMMVMCCEVR